MLHLGRGDLSKDLRGMAVSCVGILGTCWRIQGPGQGGQDAPVDGQVSTDPTFRMQCVYGGLGRSQGLVVVGGQSGNNGV